MLLLCYIVGPLLALINANYFYHGWLAIALGFTAHVMSIGQYLHQPIIGLNRFCVIFGFTRATSKLATKVCRRSKILVQAKNFHSNTFRISKIELACFTSIKERLKVMSHWAFGPMLKSLNLKDWPLRPSSWAEGRKVSILKNPWLLNCSTDTIDTDKSTDSWCLNLNLSLSLRDS